MELMSSSDHQALPGGETADALIQMAKAHGYTVSKRQLAEWHRAGYLPSPKIYPRPRGTGRGTISVYPPGTGEQLLAYCAAHQKARRLSEAAWTLWWDGGGDPGLPVRAFLAQIAMTWAARKVIVLGAESSKPSSSPELLEEAPDPLMDHIDAAQVARKLPPLAAQARKRLRNGRFSTFMRILLDVATGELQGYDFDYAQQRESEDRPTIDSGLGLGTPRQSSSRTTQPSTNHTPSALSIEIESEAALTELMDVLDEPAIEHEAETATDTELLQTRDEVRTVLGFAASFGPIMEQIAGRGKFGFAALAEAGPTMRPAEQGMLMLLWRVLRRTGYGDNIDILLAAMQQWNEVWLPTFQQLQQLRSEVPAFSEILAPGQTAKALRSERAMEQTLTTLRALYAEHQQEVQAFYARQRGETTANAEDSTSNPESEASQRE
jgi:hypothetical protein